MQPFVARVTEAAKCTSCQFCPTRQRHYKGWKECKEICSMLGRGLYHCTTAGWVQDDIADC